MPKTRSLTQWSVELGKQLAKTTIAGLTARANRPLITTVRPFDQCSDPSLSSTA